jgi:phosphatidylglycerophosphate synthase
MLSSRFRNFSNIFVIPIARLLALLRLSPNKITILGLIFSILTAFMYASGELIYAFYLLLCTCFFDVIDGTVARITKKTTKFGGFLDSVLDRYSDSIILIGIAIYLEEHFILIFIVLVGSLLVSYSRARAEMEIALCDVGIAERAERLIILAIATLLEGIMIFPYLDVFYIALAILAILTHFTVIQRVTYTYFILGRELES